MISKDESLKRMIRIHEIISDLNPLEREILLAQILAKTIDEISEDYNKEVKVISQCMRDQIKKVRQSRGLSKTE